MNESAYLKEAITRMPELRRIFKESPMCRIVTDQLCMYLTPLIPSKHGSACLLEDCLLAGVVATKTLHKNPYRYWLTPKLPNYLCGLFEHVPECLDFCIRVREDGHHQWMPLTESLTQFQRRYADKGLLIVEQDCWLRERDDFGRRRVIDDVARLMIAARIASIESVNPLLEALGFLRNEAMIPIQVQVGVHLVEP